MTWKKGENMGSFTNLENVANSVVPGIIKFLIAMGIIVCISCIFISIYFILKNKQFPKKIIKSFFGSWFIGGIITVLSGLAANYIAHFEISFNSYKFDIPLGVICLLVVFSFVYSKKIESCEYWKIA